jgi:hypothetical protein
VVSTRMQLAARPAPSAPVGRRERRGEHLHAAGRSSPLFTSSVAALTASGLCFDFSNSSYLMREGNPWPSGCTRGCNLGAITRNQSQSSQSSAITRNQGGIDHSSASSERIVHDCEEELHDEEAAEHDDEEEVDPHVPDDGCNQTSSSAAIKRPSRRSRSTRT